MTSSAREAAAKVSAAEEAAMDKRMINIHSKIQTTFLNKKKKESEAAKNKNKVKKSMEDKMLDAAEDNWDRMVKIVDDRKAAVDKKKKESEAAKNKKKKGGQK